MKILALDFDGVVADSQYEALFTSFHAYLAMNPNVRIFDGRSFICKRFEEIKKRYKKQFEEYARLRPYVKTAGDYFFILKAIDNKIKIKNQKDYNGLLIKFKDELGNFNKIFYELRDEFQKKDFDSWCSLSLPYEKIINHYKKIKKFKIVFVTNNNAQTVIRTLQSFGLGIRGEDIFDNKLGVNKKEKIKLIAGEYAVGFSEIHFIDDQVESLIKSKELGVNCYLALWGYVNKEQIDLAKKEGIVLLSEEDFSNVFK